MKEHLTIRVFGLVQGVFYRQSTKTKADELGLTGFVRNEPDGSVYLEAEGEPGKLAALRTWCQSGPARASVSRVEAQEGPVQGYTQFKIER